MGGFTQASSTGSTAAARPVQTTLDLLDELFRGFDDPHFGVRLWDGTRWGAEPGQAQTTLVLRTLGSLRTFLSRPDEVHAAECYLHDIVDVEGSMEGIMPAADWLLKRYSGLADKVRLARRLRALPRAGNLDRRDRFRGPVRLRGIKHSVRRDRDAVTYHYDVSNRFYSLWLDERMVYSCALFADPEEDLDTAQERKLEYICRKLRLRPGERLLDIGCGWGGLILHAARHHGVDATGITLSEPQAELAAARIRAAGLESRCRVLVQDYREVEPDRPFDKLVSIGMVEHVGLDHLDEYFARAFELLRKGGVFLNHGIADLPGRPPRGKRSFIDRYIFPDGDLPPLPSILAEAEKCGFEARDVESLREHYALTLGNWVERLEAHHAEAAAEAGEITYRTWRLYMSGCAHWFARGHISVFQTLLVKRDDQGRSGLPLMRADWYAPRG